MDCPETNARSNADAAGSVSPPAIVRTLPRLTGARAVLLLALCGATAVVAQPTAPKMASAGGDVETEEGIPVTHALTKEKCGTCHTSDAKGNMSRISWVRTTPEGWSQVIKRMARLNGLDINPQETREIIRYLSGSHGLAPEEAKPVMYVAENRIIVENNIPSESMRGACAACHSFGQPLSWRRSATEWKLLQDMHVAMFSQADAQYRRPAVDEPGPTMGEPIAIKQKPGGTPITQGQIALAYMSKVAPLRTADWSQWSSRVQAPRLAGKWLVSADVIGKGHFYGTLTMSPGSAPEEFNTAMALQSAADGSTMTRTGSGVVYSGYSWRGRSAPGTAPAAPDTLDNPTRETMFFTQDRKSATGRWFWGEYHEFGFDVKLTRADGSPTIGGIASSAVKAGSKGSTLKIYGDALPTNLTAKDIDLGAGLSVAKIVSATPSEIVLSVDALPTAKPGMRDVAIGSAVLSAALPVYTKVAYLKAAPGEALSRLGGAKHPKGYQRFEAWGYDAGLDGKPNTADDVKIGPVEASWAMEEMHTTYFDDDTKFIGTLSPDGLFTPNLDGPNPERSGNRNNYGEVWAVATAKSLTDDNGKPLSAKAYLVVTIPSFIRRDQPEITQ